MPTFNQLIRQRRTINSRVYNRSPKIIGPARAGVCLYVGTAKPKKPNSAIRKITKVRLTTGENIRAVIPGSGFDLQEHNTVLVRAGRARDIPGVHYKLIRNKLDLEPPHGFTRYKRRSKFGVANWSYVFRDAAQQPTQVICALRSRRHLLQSEWGLPLTWDNPSFSTARAVVNRQKKKELPRRW